MTVQDMPKTARRTLQHPRPVDHADADAGVPVRPQRLPRPRGRDQPRRRGRDERDLRRDRGRQHRGKGWFGRVGVSNSARQEGMIFEQLYEAGPGLGEAHRPPGLVQQGRPLRGVRRPGELRQPSRPAVHRRVLRDDPTEGRRAADALRRPRRDDPDAVPVPRRQVPLRPDRHPDGAHGHRTWRRRDDGRAGQPQVQPQAPPDRADRDAWRGHLDRRRGRRDRMPPQGGRRPAVRRRDRPRLRPPDQPGRRASGRELPLRTELGLLPLPLPAERRAARPADAGAARRRSSRTAR